MTEIPINRFNWVDAVNVILFLIMGYRGFLAGIGQEFLKLLGLVTGFFLSYRYYQGIGDWVAGATFLNTEWAGALVMTAMVIGGYYVVTRIFRVVEKVVQVAFHAFLSQIGGLGVGICRGLLMGSVVWVVLQQIPSPALHAAIGEESLSGGLVSRMAPAVYDFLRTLPERFLGA